MVSVSITPAPALGAETDSVEPSNAKSVFSRTSFFTLDIPEEKSPISGNTSISSLEISVLPTPTGFPNSTGRKVFSGFSEEDVA